VEPDTTERGKVQQDLARRQRLATTANVVFGCGAALAALSATVFYVYRRDVLGD
jgi:hypothetical protein